MGLRRCSEITAAGDAEAALPLTPGERAARLPQARPGHCGELTVHSPIKMGGGLRLYGAYGAGGGMGEDSSAPQARWEGGFPQGLQHSCGRATNTRDAAAPAPERTHLIVGFSPAL